MMAGDFVESAYINVANTHDVNDDGRVTAIDALVIINELNARSTGPLDVMPKDQPPSVMVDVDGDGAVSALDALRVINRLNQESFDAPAGGVAVSEDDRFESNNQRESATFLGGGCTLLVTIACCGREIT